MVVYVFWFIFFYMFVFKGYGDHRDLHVLTHSFPTRRSSDLEGDEEGGVGERHQSLEVEVFGGAVQPGHIVGAPGEAAREVVERSEEHTSELQSLMRISYAVFCLKQKKNDKQS